jgi:ABC-2 type transport system permease protein
MPARSRSTAWRPGRRSAGAWSPPSCRRGALPIENVTQISTLALTLCSFAAGLFIPLSRFSPDLQTFAKFTPLYGLSQLVHYPLAGGTLQWGWILNLAVWLAIFVAGAVWCLRRDTARV